MSESILQPIKSNAVLIATDIIVLSLLLYWSSNSPFWTAFIALGFFCRTALFGSETYHMGIIVLCIAISQISAAKLNAPGESTWLQRATSHMDDQLKGDPDGAKLAVSNFIVSSMVHVDDPAIVGGRATVTAKVGHSACRFEVDANTKGHEGSWVIIGHDCPALTDIQRGQTKQ